MKQSRIKENANGSLTVYVPKGQVNLFEWLISEGQLGLRECEGEIDEHGYNNLGVRTKQKWLGFNRT